MRLLKMQKKKLKMLKNSIWMVLSPMVNVIIKLLSIWDHATADVATDMSKELEATRSKSIC